MSKHLSGVMVAVFAAAMLFPSPAFADNRPGNVVVMGGTLSLSGGASKRNYNSFKLYVDELNARGGLLGHKVELKIYDNKQGKRRAIELYEKLITEDKVDIIIGPYPTAAAARHTSPTTTHLVLVIGQRPPSRWDG